MNILPPTITGPFVGYVALAALILGAGGGFYGGKRWSENGVTKCELKAATKEAGQGKANAAEVKRQTAGTNKAARGLEADRAVLQTNFEEVRNALSDVALASPDRANAVCFDDRWLQVDAAATRAANSRSTDKPRPVEALPAADGAQEGHGGRSDVRSDPPSGAIRRLPTDARAPSPVGEAARNPETN